MTPHFAEQLRDGGAGLGVEGVDRWERLEADLSFFVEGGFTNRGLLMQLDPKKDEVWTLRSVRPRPGIRVFGRFAHPDHFVATHAVLRASLRGKWSQEFEIEKLVCDDHWKKAFGDYPPYRGDIYSDYITENASDGESPS